MKKIVLRIILILIILAVIELYVYDFIVNDVLPTKNLFRGCSIILLSVVAFIRTFQTGRRNTLEFYDRQYADILEQLTDKKYWPYPTYSDLLFY